MQGLNHIVDFIGFISKSILQKLHKTFKIKKRKINSSYFLIKFIKKAETKNETK